MIVEYLERKRREPRAVRQRFALTFSILATLSIVLVWLSALYINSLGNRTNDNSDTENVQKTGMKDVHELFNASNVFSTEPIEINESDQESLIERWRATSGTSEGGSVNDTVATSSSGRFDTQFQGVTPASSSSTTTTTTTATSVNPSMDFGSSTVQGTGTTFAF